MAEQPIPTPAPAAVEGGPPAPDLTAAQLMAAAFEDAPVTIFDQPVEGMPDEAQRLATLKLGADLLVSILIAIFYGDRVLPR